jgi:hypothetical protein
VKERSHWKDYMAAYEDAIRATATEECPWYVVPADDKKNMRLIVSAAILAEMQTHEAEVSRAAGGAEEASPGGETLPAGGVGTKQGLL